MKTTPSLFFCAVGLFFMYQGNTTNPPKADRVVVIKHERKLTLMHAGKPLKTYAVALGTEPTGAKESQGDHRTPEGMYLLDSRNDHTNQFTSHIPAQRTASGLPGLAFRLEGTFSFMDCRMATAL
jgi:L,D-transpeptidase catalytic domain